MTQMDRPRASARATASAATQRGGCGVAMTSCARPPMSAERTTLASATTAAGSEIVELVCAALDCPQLWALMLHAPAATSERVVTAVLETRLEHPVKAGEPHVVIGWPIGRDGRRWLAGAAVFGPVGELCAAGRQTAAAVGGWGVPLGREHWATAPVATP